MKIKIEYIGIAFLFLISFFLSRECHRDQVELDKDGSYVLGYLKGKSFGNETGWMYEYVYVFEQRSYYRSFSGPVSSEILSDSLMFFKINPNNPKNCIQLQKIRVPYCLTLKDVPRKGWKELPLNYCDSSSSNPSRSH